MSDLLTSISLTCTNRTVKLVIRDSERCNIYLESLISPYAAV